MTASNKLSAEKASCLYLCTELKDGSPIVLRAIQPDDKYELKQIYPKLSERTLYMRFFNVIPRPSLDALSRYTTVDFGTHLALVAILSKEQRIVGACRLIRSCDQSHQAELGCIVIDEMQHRGVGRVMIENLFALGKAWGVNNIAALVHSQNHAMMQLLKTTGYPVEILYGDGEFSLSIDISDEPDQSNVSHHANLGAMHQGIEVSLDND